MNGPGGTKIASYTSTGKKKGSGKKGPAWVCGYYEPAASDFAVPAPAVGSDAVVPQDGVVYAFICLFVINVVMTAISVRVLVK